MTSRVINYTGRVSRWQPDARERLERAALELFAQQGFAATTVPEITARAGLTTRTFFRHFADKREVLFAADEIPALATRMLAEAPAGLDPATLIIEGLTTVAETLFEDRRQEIRARREIVSSDASLRERELHKRAAVSEAIRVGLADRGVEVTRAALFAEAGVTLLHVALDRWLADEGDRTLAATILDTLASFQTVLGSFPGGPASSPAEPASSPSGPASSPSGPPALR